MAGSHGKIRAADVERVYTWLQGITCNIWTVSVKDMHMQSSYCTYAMVLMSRTDRDLTMLAVSAELFVQYKAVEVAKWCSLMPASVWPDTWAALCKLIRLQPQLFRDGQETAVPNMHGIWRCQRPLEAQQE